MDISPIIVSYLLVGAILGTLVWHRREQVFDDTRRDAIRRAALTTIFWPIVLITLPLAGRM